MAPGDRPVGGRIRAYSQTVGARRKALWVAAASAVAVEAAVLKRRTGRIGGDVIVRCRRGHYFTTLWVPGVSIKALRLGWWRLQWCPVGRHVTLVTPAERAKLSEYDRASGSAVHDACIP